MIKIELLDENCIVQIIDKGEYKHPSIGHVHVGVSVGLRSGADQQSTIARHFRYPKSFLDCALCSDWGWGGVAECDNPQLHWAEGWIGYRFEKYRYRSRLFIGASYIDIMDQIMECLRYELEVLLAVVKQYNEEATCVGNFKDIGNTLSRHLKALVGDTKTDPKKV